MKAAVERELEFEGRKVPLDRLGGKPLVSTTSDRLRAMIAAQVQEILRNDPVVRLREDPDAVHDMRVAVRRLRSILRSARVMLDEGWVDRARAELDWLAGSSVPSEIWMC